MSEGPQWYVSVEGQQHGPYSSEQLVEFTGTGNITRESMVWAEGMAEWLPAAQIEGLFTPEAPAPAAAPVLVRSATPASNFMRPGQAAAYSPTATAYAGAVTAQGAGEFRHPQINAASPGLFYGAFAIGVILMIITVILSFQIEDRPEAMERMSGILVGVFLGGIVFLVIAQILALIVIHRSWKCISLAGASVSPGMAVGLLFVPLFNLYWLFRAYYGFAQDWNRIMACHEETRLAPRMPEGLFMAYCITILLFWPVGVILLFPVIGSMCKAINFVAFRPVQQPGTMRFR